jgi:hypothetical protein
MKIGVLCLIFQRLSDYISMILILPPLVFKVNFGPPPLIDPLTDILFTFPSISKSLFTRPPLVEALIST